MTCKQFFKSTVFKCLATLLCVLLLCGVFLTVMNGLLEVSDEEKFQRALGKIYGKTVSTETVAVADYTSTATINEAYKVKDDGNYLIKATGKGGYSGGTVTCWVVVLTQPGKGVTGVGKVVIDSNVNQSYIANINDKFLSGFSENYTGEAYSPYDGFVKTGATMSATAICNAVNGAVKFVNAQLGNVAENPYKDCLYITNIDIDNTSHTPNDDGTVTFHVVTSSYGMAASFNIDITVDREGVITDYVITKNGSTNGYDKNMHENVLNGSLFVNTDVETLTEIGVDYSSMTGDLKAGATQSSYLCFSAAVFAAANYEQFLPETPGEEEDEKGGTE